MNSLFMDTLFDYFRLILYPILALTFVTYAFSGEQGGSAKSAKLHIFIAGFFLMLWGTSIVGYLFHGSDAMIRYNNVWVVPVLLTLAIYTWVLIYRNNRDWLNKEKQNINKEKQNGLD